MSATQHEPTRSLGAALERDRLERRARRMIFAVGSLRQRAERERGAAPRHLQQIIVEFEAQIETMNARLRELAGERTAKGRPQRGRDPAQPNTDESRGADLPARRPERLTPV